MKNKKISRQEAWVMKLKPGNEKIYKEKHDNIWPEMLEIMKKNGTIRFNIFRYDNLLFVYREIDDSYVEPKNIDQIVWKWWKMMSPLMETNLDYSPVTESLETMFLYSGDEFEKKNYKWHCAHIGNPFR